MHIRPMQPDDLEFACRCAGQEGWRTETSPEFQADLECDPLGCFVAEESQGPVGLCISVAYGAVGFLGELIVLPSHRRIGIGSALCERALRHLKDQGTESIFLDGDENAIPMYERFGFRKLFRRPRFAGPVAYGSDRAVRGMLVKICLGWNRWTGVPSEQIDLSSFAGTSRSTRSCVPFLRTAGKSSGLSWAIWVLSV
ncbi:MAG: GNAT family N-acetyltransferase [Anaerolineales bacterium]